MNIIIIKLLFIFLFMVYVVIFVGVVNFRVELRVVCMITRACIFKQYYCLQQNYDAEIKKVRLLMELRIAETTTTTNINRLKLYALKLLRRQDLTYITMSVSCCIIHRMHHEFGISIIIVTTHYNYNNNYYYQL